MRIKITAAIILVVGIGVPVFSAPSLQIRVFGATGFAENPSNVDDVADQFKSRSDAETFTGITTEIVCREFGVGLRYQSLFSSYTVPESAGVGETVDWWSDWKSDIFVSYHLFGSPSFLDPFVALGSGVAFRTDLPDGVYYDTESGTWMAGNRDDNDSLDNITSASIYQYAGVGGQIYLGGLMLGTALNYNLTNQTIRPDGSDWSAYPLDRFEVRVFGGVAIGAR